MPMVSFRLPDELLERVAKAAEGTSRSKWLVAAVEEKLARSTSGRRVERSVPTPDGLVSRSGSGPARVEAEGPGGAEPAAPVDRAEQFRLASARLQKLRRGNPGKSER